MNNNFFKMLVLFFMASIAIYVVNTALAESKPKEMPIDIKLNAEVILKPESSLVIQMANGLIISLTSNNDKDEVGIAHGFNSFATIDAPAEGNTSLIRYFHDGKFDVSVKDTNGDGMPDKMLKWKDGELVHVFKIETNLIEIQN